jgi:IS66 C-terminal element
MVVGHLSSAAAALDLAAELHEIAPGLPILLATASADDFGPNALVTAGISDVVAWPIIATEMAMALQNCLHRGPFQVEHGSTRHRGRILRNVESNNWRRAWHRWAIANTLIQSCKLNGVELLAYLTDVLQRIVSEQTKNLQLHALLPWNWRPPATVAAA